MILSITWTQLKRGHRFVNGLRKTAVFDLVASWLAGFVAAGFLWSFALLVGYPSPFTMKLLLLDRGSLYIRFGAFVRDSQEISGQLKLYTWSIAIEMTNATLYSAYNVVFMGLGVKQQIAFSLLLPLMKIASKNVTR